MTELEDLEVRVIMRKSSFVGYDELTDKELVMFNGWQTSSIYELGNRMLGYSTKLLPKKKGRFNKRMMQKVINRRNYQSAITNGLSAMVVSEDGSVRHGSQSELIEANKE